MKNKTIAIVLSGGKGKRMGSSVSKQYLMLGSKPVLYYSLKAFDDSNIDEIIVVVGKGDREFVQKEIIQKYNINKVTDIVEGGAERYNSVYNALLQIDSRDNCKSNGSKENKYVLIHDGARPFIETDKINTIIKEVISQKACILGVRAKDTVKISDTDNYVASTPSRSNVWQVQTPQAFEFELVKECYDKIINSGSSNITDDSMVVETASNIKIKIIEGSYTNIKITTPEDLKIGESIINA